MAETSGCTRYITRTVDIYFAGDCICCSRCPLFETYSRKQCRKTGEYIVDERTVGGWCPLVDPDTGAIEGIFNHYEQGEQE